MAKRITFLCNTFFILLSLLLLVTTSNAATWCIGTGGDDWVKDNWTELSELPVGLADLSCTNYNGNITCFGGYGTTSSDYRNETVTYFPANDTWITKTSIPTARMGLIAVLNEDRSYVFSGYNGTVLGTLETYNHTTDSWTTLNSSPITGDGPCGFEKNGIIHLFRGTNHYEYNISSDTYTQKNDIPQSTEWASLAHHDDTVYLIGGYESGPGALNNTQILNISSDTWTTGSPMPRVLYGQARENIIIDNKAYILGGKSNNFHNTVLVYDTMLDIWSARPSNKYWRDGVAGIIINNDIYIVGGRNQTSGQYGVKYLEKYTFSRNVSMVNCTPYVSNQSGITLYGNWYPLVLDDWCDTRTGGVWTLDGGTTIKHNETEAQAGNEAIELNWASSGRAKYSFQGSLSDDYSAYDYFVFWMKCNNSEAWRTTYSVYLDSPGVNRWEISGNLPTAWTKYKLAKWDMLNGDFSAVSSMQFDWDNSPNTQFFIDGVHFEKNDTYLTKGNVSTRIKDAEAIAGGAQGDLFQSTIIEGINVTDTWFHGYWNYSTDNSSFAIEDLGNVTTSTSVTFSHQTRYGSLIVTLNTKNTTLTPELYNITIHTGTAGTGGIETFVNPKWVLVSGAFVLAAGWLAKKWGNRRRKRQ